MEDEDTVQSSDADERELEDATKRDYWAQFGPKPTTDERPQMNSPREDEVLGEPSLDVDMKGNVHLNNEDGGGISSGVEMEDLVNEARYPLRPRKAFQLNPYAYDKKMYKHQMRANPEAIIRVLSPKRGDVDEGTQEEFIPDSYEPTYDEPILASEDQDSKSADEIQKWIPKALENPSSSDDDDDAPLSPLAGQNPFRRRYQPRKRPKRFPLPKLVSTEIESSMPNVPLVEPQTMYEDDELGGRYTSPLNTTMGDDSHSAFNEPPRSEDEPISLPRLSSNESDVDFPQTDPKPNVKSKNQLRALNRMFPTVLVNKVLANSQPVRKRARFSSHSEAEEVSVLQPGQTRIRKLGRTIDVNKIRGDSESSDIEVAELNPFHSNLSLEEEIEKVPKHSQRSPRTKGVRSPKRVPVVHVSSDSGDDEASDSAIDDVDISSWFEDRKVHHQPWSMPETSLVDYMLNGTRRVGGPRVRRSNSVRQKGVRITTDGARRSAGLQTKLPFARRDSAPVFEPEAEERPMAKHTYQFTNKGATLRKKRKRRNDAPNHAYTFTTANTRITSTHSRTSAILVNLQDQGFHNALTPTRIPILTAKAIPPPKQYQRTDSMRRSHSSNNLPIRSPRKRSAVQTTISDHVGYDPSSAVPTRFMENQPKKRQKLTADLKVHRLPSGITFPGDSYIGKAWLHELVELVKGTTEAARPYTFSWNGIVLNPDMPVSEFCASLSTFFDRLLDLLASPPEFSREELKGFEQAMHVVCQYISWVAENAADETACLRDMVFAHLRNLIARVEVHSTSPDFDTAAKMLWFSLEVSVRLALVFKKVGKVMAIDGDLRAGPITVKLFAQLLGRGFRGLIASIYNPKDPSHTSCFSRAAEIWVCLIHLVTVLDNPDPQGSRHPFWQTVKQCMEKETAPPSFESSEKFWLSTFSLMALAQFSVHGMTTSNGRLPAAWDIVVLALKRIQLAANPEDEVKFPHQSLEKRDEYVWLITARCFHLWERWKWDLGEATPMLSALVDIFKSRKFANLRMERPDFSRFLLDHDLRLLSGHRADETAFSMFLKLIVQAGSNNESEQGPSSRLKKLLSLAVPVGSLRFTKVSPPSSHELSMLQNRISAIAVAIYLDPTSASSRLLQARRYVNFKDADDNTRNTCIRGMMHLAILVQHCGLSLHEILVWLTEMTNVLINEYKGFLTLKAGVNSARDRMLLCIHLLLGSVRRIIETPHMDPLRTDKVYPNPALLEGPWITEVFSTKSNLALAPKTGLEICRLIQAFLRRRSAVMPPPVRPSIARVNQESQGDDEFGVLDDFDFDDPLLAAALGDTTVRAEVNQVSEDRVCQVIVRDISPAIYELLRHYTSDPEDLTSLDEKCKDADAWIDCWVGCAEIAVRNKKREWSSFLEFGPQSWEKIIQPAWRRRVGLRFMLMVLRLDPMAYLTYKDHFIRVLLQSLTTSSVTIENDYSALVFSVDGLQHPLLVGIPCERPAPNEDYRLSINEFLDSRLSIIEVIFRNLFDLERLEESGRSDLTERVQTFLGGISSMFSAMQDNYQGLQSNLAARRSHVHFCHRVLESLRKYPTLESSPRLSRWIAWISSLEKDNQS